MIDELRKNINTEIEMLRELSYYFNKSHEAKSQNEKNLLNDTVDSLKNSIKTINKSVPAILNGISLAKPLTILPSNLNLERVSYKKEMGNIEVILSPKDKQLFLKEL